MSYENTPSSLCFKAFCFYLKLYSMLQTGLAFNLNISYISSHSNLTFTCLKKPIFSKDQKLLLKPSSSVSQSPTILMGWDSLKLKLCFIGLFSNYLFFYVLTDKGKLPCFTVLIRINIKPA